MTTSVYKLNLFLYFPLEITVEDSIIIHNPSSSRVPLVLQQIQIRTKRNWNQPSNGKFNLKNVRPKRLVKFFQNFQQRIHYNIMMKE